MSHTRIPLSPADPAHAGATIQVPEDMLGSGSNYVLHVRIRGIVVGIIRKYQPR